MQSLPRGPASFRSRIAAAKPNLSAADKGNQTMQGTCGGRDGWPTFIVQGAHYIPKPLDLVGIFAAEFVRPFGKS